jgi:hypothetical protein
MRCKGNRARSSIWGGFSIQGGPSLDICAQTFDVCIMDLCCVNRR